jgi:hypothetical protein
VVPDDTTLVVPLLLMFEVVEPLTLLLTVAVVLAGLLTVKLLDELPFPLLTAIAPAAELLSAPEMPVPTAVVV